MHISWPFSQKKYWLYYILYTISYKNVKIFRLRLFWVKMISGNHFHPFPHVWLQRKIQFSGNCIPVDHNFPLWPGNEFTFSFSLQFISGSLSRIATQREERSETQNKRTHSNTTSSDPRTATQRERDCSSSDPHFRWTIHSDPHFISPIHEPERSDPRTATQSEIDWDRDLATARDRAVDRDLRREIAPARSRSQIAIVDGILLGFVFSFFFSKYQKIFSGKFFEMQPNTEKYFPFPEISISGKYVFSGKYFTATKHSLRLKRKTAKSNQIQIKLDNRDLGSKPMTHFDDLSLLDSNFNSNSTEISEQSTVALLRT